MAIPDPARYAREAAALLGADYEDLDRGEGYLFRISRGSASVLIGAGAICSFPVNSATAVAVARDKSHTASALSAAGIPSIPGRLFFIHRRRAGLRGPGRERGDALAYARGVGFPVFCKPNTGARGNFAEVISSPENLAEYMERASVDFESILVQPVISGVEHRVLLFDEKIVFHAIKASPALLCDGVSNAREILNRLNSELGRSGLSAYPETVLALAGFSPEDIPQANTRISLPGRRNLSADGDIAHFSTEAPAVLAELGRRAARCIGLRVAAIDLFDRSARQDLSDILIIEVNGNPGLRTLELAGRSDLISELWTRMLEEILSR